MWFSVRCIETSTTTTNIKKYTTDETVAQTTKASRNVTAREADITSLSSNGSNQTTNYTITQPCCASPNNTYQTSGALSKTSTISLSESTMDDQPLGSNTTVETTEAPRNNQTIDTPGENKFVRNYCNHRFKKLYLAYSFEIIASIFCYVQTQHSQLLLE